MLHLFGKFLHPRSYLTKVSNQLLSFTVMFHLFESVLSFKFLRFNFKLTVFLVLEQIVYVIDIFTVCKSTDIYLNYAIESKIRYIFLKICMFMNPLFIFFFRKDDVGACGDITNEYWYIG